MLKTKSSHVLLPQINQNYIQKYKNHRISKNNYEIIERPNFDDQIYQPNAPQVYHGVELTNFVEKKKGVPKLEELKEEEIDYWVA